MIFVGADISDPRSHFVTNVVNSIGSGGDLIIDLRTGIEMEEIVDLINNYCAGKSERFVIYNAWEDEVFPLLCKKYFPELKLITFFSDDEWRHQNYDRYLALYSDIFTIAVRDHLSRYQECGLNHVHYMQWGCNEMDFHPIEGAEKIYDVTFIGAAYGKRIETVKFLHRQGINVRVFGPGWGRVAELKGRWGGVLSHQEMIQVISQSKINLNFLWTSQGNGSTTIKGRTMELAACRGFQLSNPTDEFQNYGFVPGENVAVFLGERDLYEKIKYYLEHQQEREEIAAKSYTHVLKNLTWKHQFDNLFQRLEAGVATLTIKRYRIMVVIDDAINHQISSEDSRLEIYFVSANCDWRAQAVTMDGVITLRRHSTLNNETLFMMVFGLVADQSDIIASNFYLIQSKGHVWIRFADRLIEQKKWMLLFLPIECIMFSGCYAAANACKLSAKFRSNNISYIEFPSFSIKLSFAWERIVRLCFSYHRSSQKLIFEAINQMRFGQAMSILSDKVWQKLFF